MDYNRTTWSLLEPLIFERDFLHLEEICRRLNRGHSFVRRYLNEFVGLGVLDRKNVGRMTMYRIDYSCPFILDILVLIEKEKILGKGDLILREVIFGLREILNKKDLCLIFGSAVNNNEKASDIDVLVVGDIGENTKENIEMLGGKVNKSIHLVDITGFGEIGGALRKEIQRKHLIVQGSENIVRWLI